MHTVRWSHAAVVVLVGAGVGAIVGSQQVVPPDQVVVVEGLTGDWTLGDYQLDTTAMIGAAGGEVMVSDGVLAGLRVEVPAAAVAADTTVVVEHAEIVSQTWGAMVHPVTPAIRVTVGDGANTAAAMTVTVPVDLRDGQFALGLFVHEGGVLEGIPLASGDASRLTLATQHFSEWFVSAFDPTSLPAQIMTGFTPGRDNWQFTNHGSWTSPGGICAGMSTSSMWYYLEVFRPLDGVAPPLYNWFDYPHGTRTKGFTDDDAHAIRFASMVQADGHWDSGLVNNVYATDATVWDFYRDARDAAAAAWHYQAFRYSMFVSGEPQLMLLSKAPRKGGHAVVAYGVTNGLISVGGSTGSGGQVWISDPNHPTHGDVVTFDAGSQAFVPYQAALQASGTVEGYGFVGYAAKSALFDWNQIGVRYSQAVDGSIGSAVFPELVVYQTETDPVSGAVSVVRTTSPTVDATGRITLDFTVAPAEVGMGTWVRVYDEGGTRPIAEAVSYATAVSGGADVDRSATFTPGLEGGTYKLVVMVGRSWGNPAQTTYEFLDAVPLVVGPAPAATTTTPTVVPTVPPTVPPTTPAPTTVPATTVPTVSDCLASCPPGVAGLQCRLQCEAIGEASTGTSW